MQFFFGIAYSSFLILPKFLSSHLGASDGRIGLISAMFGLANVSIAWFVPRALRRLDVGGTARIACLIMGVASAGFALVQDTGVFAATFRAMQGVSWALMFSATSFAVTQFLPASRMARGIAISSGTTLLTNAIAPSLAEPMLSSFGPRVTFIAAAASAFVAVLFALRIPKTSEPHAKTNETRSSAPLPVKLLVSASVLGVACGVVFTFYQPLALSRGITRVADFLIGHTIAAVALRLLVGSLLEKLGARRMAGYSLCAYGIVVAVLATLSPGLLFPMGLAFGCVHGAFFPALMTLGLESATAAERPRVMTWINATFNVGLLVVAFLGPVANEYGYAALFVPVGLATTLTALAVFREPARIRT